MARVPNIRKIEDDNDHNPKLTTRYTWYGSARVDLPVESDSQNIVSPRAGKIQN
jgi:hypothetical protein